MRKRIFRSIVALTVLCLLFVSAFLCLIFYNQLSFTVRENLQQRAEIFRESTSQTVFETLAAAEQPDIRISLIARDGEVIYDNRSAAGTMPNHLDRTEVGEAIEHGSGASRRFSETLDEETYYFAVRLEDGNILRLSKTTSSIFGLYIESMPTVIGVIALAIIVGYLFAGNLTKRIVNPINRVDLTAELTSPYDELIPFVKTISQQKEHIDQQMMELKNRTNTIEAIMDSMSEGIIIIDPKGVVISVNKSAASFFEIDTVEGKNILELFRRADLIENARSALNGTRNEMNIEHGDNVYRVYFSSVKNSGAILLFLDITERVNVERLRREFSANVSHELKTPLTSIFGHAEMLNSGMVKEGDEQGFYKQIQDEAARMIALIDDIILISKLDENDASDFELLECVDLKAVAAEAVSALRQKADDKKVSITLSAEPVEMKANHSQIFELFQNLIDNSIKYNKQGGKINIELGFADDGRVNILIADTGIGIPENDKVRVFERFYRVDKSRSKSTGGTGLGLAIVKHIVFTHKGKIHLDSVENEGTTIQIVFDKT